MRSKLIALTIAGVLPAAACSESKKMAGSAEKKSATARAEGAPSDASDSGEAATAAGRADSADPVDGLVDEGGLVTEGHADGGLGTTIEADLPAQSDGLGAVDGSADHVWPTLTVPSEVPSGGKVPLYPPAKPPLAAAKAAAVVFGAGNGGGPHVVEARGSELRFRGGFMAYDSQFRGGVRVATKVSNAGDRYVATGAGAGGGPHVRVFLNGSEYASFYAYEESFRGGVYVALGDLDGDGNPDLITGPGGGGGPRVRAFSLKDGQEMVNFLVFDSVAFRGGVRVAAGDLDSDGRDDIIVVPGPGGGPVVSAYSVNGLAKIAHFAVWPDQVDTFRGGLHVAFGRFGGTPAIVVGAGTPEEESHANLMAPGTPGAPRVTIARRDGSHIGNYFAFGSESRFGARVATADVGADGTTDVIVCAGHGGAAHVKTFRGTSDQERVESFFVYDEHFRGGCYVSGN